MTQQTFSGTHGDMKCECADHACPVCKGNCRQVATGILYRVDMDDVTGTAFCEGCGEDAMESGLFTAAANMRPLEPESDMERERRTR